MSEGRDGGKGDGGAPGVGLGRPIHGDLRPPGKRPERALHPKVKTALALHRQRRISEAEFLYDEVLAEDPDNVDALEMKGVLALERRELALSGSLLRRALDLAPNSPICNHNLATLEAQVGELEAAEAHYRAAIRLKPDYAEAYYNLTGAHRITAPAELIEQVEALLRKGDALGREDKVFLHFAAGRLYDAARDYDTAFRHYHEGNRTRGIIADMVAEHRFVDEQIKAFPKSRFRMRRPKPGDGPRPIFIVGMPRSGTSLAEQILASHEDVHGAGELPDIPSIVRALQDYHPRHERYPLNVKGLKPEVFAGFGATFRKRLGVLAGGRVVAVDKNPVNFRHLGLIALMFPDAVIVHCRRHPLDTIVSCYQQNFTTGQGFARDLTHLAAFYREYERLIAHWRDVLPLPIHDLRYETLVSEPETTIRALLDHCRLDWQDACLAPQDTERPVYTASSWQVREPINARSVGKWKRYDRNLGVVWMALGDKIAAYEAEDA